MECRRKFQEAAPCLFRQGNSCIDQDAADAFSTRIVTHDQRRDPGNWHRVMEHGGPVHGNQPDGSLVLGCKQNRIGRSFRELSETCPHVLNGKGIAKLAQQFLHSRAVAQTSRSNVNHGSHNVAQARQTAMR